MPLTSQQLEANIEQYWFFSSTGLAAARQHDASRTSDRINEMAFFVGSTNLPDNLRKSAQKSAMQMAAQCLGTMSSELADLISNPDDALQANIDDIMQATGLAEEIEFEEQTIEACRLADVTPLTLTFDRDGAA